MLRKLRKRIRQRNLKQGKMLAAALCTAAVLALPTPAAWAALPSQSFLDGAAHTVNDDIAGNLFVGLSGTSATMSGHRIDNAAGVAVFATKCGSITLNGVAVTAQDIGIGTDEGGRIAMTGGSITVTGANATGVHNYYSSSTITLTDVAVEATGTALSSSGNNVLTATVHGQNITGGTYLMYADFSARIDFQAYGGSRLYGIAALSNGGTANLTLNSSTWIMPGSSSLTSLTLNNGSVAFSPPSSGGYKTLAVSGDLAGSGGSFHLNTNLAAGTGDLITVGGTASGSHTLYITNLGGAAAARTAVKVAALNAGAANTATFSGGGDQGAWRYGVAPGSAISSYSGVNSLTDYYFYNTGRPSNITYAAIGDSAAGTVLWYGELNEIKKRLGDLRLGARSGDDFWVRTYADKFNVTPVGSEAFSQIVRGVELGKDNPQAFAGGRKFTGFVLGAGRADNTFSTGGTGEIKSFYAGAYGSWLRDDGVYFDLVGKYNRFRHSFSSPILGGGSDSGSYRNTGLGLSAEIGKRIERGNGVFIQPEAELSALWSGSAGYTSANGLAIEVPSANSLQLRLGCTAGRKWQDGDGASRQVYGKLSWVNEFRGDSRTVVDSVPFDASLKGHQWVTGIGFVEDGKRYQLYLDVEKSWGNTVSKAWGFNAGYRWKF